MSGAAATVAVRGVLPAGGPHLGGTNVTVVGTAFDVNVNLNAGGLGALAVQTIIPSWGPAEGGTEVSVHLTDPSMLIDLGGIRCRFVVGETPLTVFGRLRKDAIRCRSPASAADGDASVQVSINGDEDFSVADASKVFTYRPPACDAASQVIQQCTWS